MSGPCVCAFDKGDEELRRPNVRGIMMAKKKQIESLSPADLGVSMEDGGVNIESIGYPPEKPAGQTFQGAASASEVVIKLREEANII